MAFSIARTCDGCSACARRCPVAAITGQVGAPYAILADLCIDCGACGLACRRNAILTASGQIAPRLPLAQRPRPVIDSDRCNGCQMCVDFCAFACLRIIGPRYQGVVALANARACVSCGECAAVCSKGAIALVSGETAVLPKPFSGLAVGGEAA